MGDGERLAMAVDSCERRPDDELEQCLVRDLRRRDRAALGRLVERYGATLTRVAWLYLADTHAAEDAAQEALIAAWDGAGRTSESTRLRPWLLGILMNRCRKHLRTAQRRQQRERAAARPEPCGGRCDCGDLDVLRAALERLDDEHREVVILRYHQGLSVEESSAALGIPPGTVKSRCHVALGRLRELMEAER